jgi:hypothetical protein
MKKLGLITALSFITGCSSVKVQDYNNEKPVLVLENYLNGKLDAYGIFQDRSGLVAKRFHVVMDCKWENGIGTLQEDFIYSDGTKSRRVWTIRKTADGKYLGTAGDVVGEALGESAGNAFHWSYTMDLPVGKQSYHVFFDDWMYLMDNKIMLNKSKMSKFGIELGEVTLTFVKRGV